MTDHAPTPLGRCEMVLRDGRVIPLSGLTIDDAIARLQHLGIRPDDVRETRHYLTGVGEGDARARSQ